MCDGDNMLRNKKAQSLPLRVVIVSAILLVVAIVLFFIIQNFYSSTKENLNETQSIIDKNKEEALSTSSVGGSSVTKQEASLSFNEVVPFSAYEGSSYEKRYNLNVVCGKSQLGSCSKAEFSITDENGNEVDCGGDLLLGESEFGCCKNKRVNVCFKVSSVSDDSIDFEMIDVCSQSLEGIRLGLKSSAYICWPPDGEEREIYKITWESKNKAYVTKSGSTSLFDSSKYANFKIVNMYPEKEYYCSVKTKNGLKVCTVSIPFGIYVESCEDCSLITFSVVEKSELENFNYGKETGEKKRLKECECKG